MSFISGLEALAAVFLGASRVRFSLCASMYVHYTKYVHSKNFRDCSKVQIFGLSFTSFFKLLSKNFATYPTLSEPELIWAAKYLLSIQN